MSVPSRLRYIDQSQADVRCVPVQLFENRKVRCLQMLHHHLANCCIESRFHQPTFQPLSYCLVAMTRPCQKGLFGRDPSSIPGQRGSLANERKGDPWTLSDGVPGSFVLPFTTSDRRQLLNGLTTKLGGASVGRCLVLSFCIWVVPGLICQFSIWRCGEDPLNVEQCSFAGGGLEVDQRLRDQKT